jgi:hypothetical protein
MYVTLKRFRETTVVVGNKSYAFVFACAIVRVDVGALALECACALIFLIIQHAMRRHIVTCDLSGSTIFFDIVS